MGLRLALLGQLVHQRRQLHARLEQRHHAGRGRRRTRGRRAPRITLVASSTVSNSLRGMPIMSQMTSSGNGWDMHLDQVGLALLAEPVDDLGADRLDRIEHALQLPRRERAGDDAALTGVARVVHVDERPEEVERLRRHVGDRHARPSPSRSPAGRRLISTTSAKRVTRVERSTSPDIGLSKATRRERTSLAELGELRHPLGERQLPEPGLDQWGLGRAKSCPHDRGNHRAMFTGVERGRGACPRASPAPGRPGWRGPPRRASAGSRCGRGHVLGPRVAVAEEVERGVDGEVRGRDVVEVVPGHRERHRHARPDPRAVRGDHGGAADPGRVDEHLAAAVLLDERGGGDRRDRAARPARRWPGWPRPRPRSIAARRRSGRTRARPWPRWSSPRRRGRRRPAPGGPAWAARDRHREARRPRAGRGRAPGGSMRSGWSARTSVGWYSTARWLANHSSVRRSLHSAYDTSRFDASAQNVTVGTHVGRVLGHVLLHERLLAAVDADDRQRPIRQHRDDPVAAPRRGSRRGRAWSRSAPSNSGWSRFVSDTPSRVSSALPALTGVDRTRVSAEAVLRR